MAKQQVILPHSSILDRTPESGNCEAGELFINGASGNGTSFLSTLKSDGTIAKFHEDDYLLSKISGASSPVIITFPSEALATADTQTGRQGEVFYMPDPITGDSFYTTIGAETSDTKATYFEKLKAKEVLLYGNVPNYIPVSYIEDTTTDSITLTWHTHFWQERDDEKMSNTIADCICVIDFEDKEVNFAMAQYGEDEAHMALPYKIVLDIQTSKNDDGDSITTISLKDINNESLTCSQIVGWSKAGYRFIFGTLNSDGTFVAADQDYDIWFFSDTQIALRYPEIDRGSATGSTYYYTHSYSVAVFDASGVIQSNNTTDTFIKGYSYSWKPIMKASGDTYITATIAKDSLGSSNVLNINAKTKSIAMATSASTGLATAYDVKTYIDEKMSGSTASYELRISDDGIVTCVKNTTDEGFQIDDDGIVSLL